MKQVCLLLMLTILATGCGRIERNTEGKDKPAGEPPVVAHSTASAPATTPKTPNPLAGEMEAISQSGFQAIKETPELRRRWWEMVWKAFPQNPRRYNPDFADFNMRAFFKSPPAPGIHPRVYLRPETLEDLRTSLQTDPAKQKYFEIYKQNCESLYSKPGPKALFTAYLNQETGPEIDKLVKQHGYHTANYMMWESLRILVEDDRGAGERLARATDHYATRLHQVFSERKVEEEKFYEAHRALPDYMQEKVLGDKQYQEITGYFDQYNICFIYDFLYPYMSDAQRANLRSLIAKLTRNIWIHGMGTADTGGNWGPHHWKGAIAALTIEGEEGYAAKAVKGLRQVMNSYYMGDFTEAGVGWEGLGKGTIAPVGVIIAANRGWDLAANQNIRKVVSSVLINASLPDGEHLLALGGLGSSHAKVNHYARYSIIMKHYYPEDPGYDYLMRLYLGKQCENLEYGRGFNHHYAGIHSPITNLICLQNYETAKSDSQAREQAVAHFGTTFFCPEFAFLSTRTDWTRTAAWLGFSVRSYNYGHCRNDRGMFTFAANGHQWSIYPWGRGDDDWGNSYSAQNASVMSIDNHGTLGEPARMIGYHESTIATFATGDIKHSWDWRNERAGANKGADSISPVTLAKMQPLYTGGTPSRDLSLSLYPHWRQPGEPMGPDLRIAYFPVERAYRTVGLVKHAQPYAIVADDLQKDSQPRLYTWHMTTEPDVVLESRTGNTVVLGEKDGSRKLLVTVVDSANPASDFQVRLVDLWMGITGKKPSKQLQISCVNSGVRLKVLLFPYDTADGPPEFSATLDGDELVVNHPGGVDTYRFSPDGRGMSEFAATIGSEHIHYSVTQTPLPGKAAGPEGAAFYELN